MKSLNIILLISILLITLGSEAHPHKTVPPKHKTHALTDEQKRGLILFMFHQFFGYECPACGYISDKKGFCPYDGSYMQAYFKL